MTCKTSKTFLRKTKRGNILKIVREHYLRDDIWCGSKCCVSCVHNENDLVLSDNPTSLSVLYTQRHYLLLDTNVVLDQIDVLEEDALCNIIILQTVLEEVKHKSSAVYKRLRDIIGNPKRHFYVFVNEHHKDTYVERQPGEKANDRNDRAIRVGCVWYNKHINMSRDGIQVILLTDDVDNRNKAIAEGLVASSVKEYISSLKDFPGLEDKLSKRNYEEGPGQALYPTHLTPVQVHEGIRAGQLLQGSFQASRENYMEGYVSVEGREKLILVVGRTGMNRSVDGDTVALVLFPEDQWNAPSGLVLQEEQETVEGGDVAPGAVNIPVSERVPTGQVVGIIRRRWRQYCGVLQPTLVKGTTRHLFVPAERKIPKVRIETRQADVLSSQRIIVAMDSWPRHSRYPLGHLVRALGPLGNKDTENEVLLLEHDVPHSKFSEAVLSCLPTMPWTITAEDEARRVDLRHIDVCSVDPPGCTDIDDALHCRPLNTGTLEVGVHIADVSHFIRPGTHIDKEAALRATTVYLVDRRIDMVPELLSSNLCSLRGDEDRLSFSVIWEIDEDANILNTKFHKSIIRSRRALTYEEAQLIIDDASQHDAIALSLRGLNNLAKKLKKRRIDNGALVLASPEIRFQVDSETHDPIDVQAKQLRETNSMVEEFMLLANISVAEKIEKEFPECAMLRRHPAPPKENFEPLIKAARHQGFEINIETGKDLATSLDDAEHKDNAYFNTMLRILATRCMMQAVYFTSGTLQQSEYFHYGLAAPIYTHFTSPIRRYADVIVHRLLAVCVGADGTYPELLDKRRSSNLCVNLNFRNRMAQLAGRASVALHTHLFFRGRVQDEEGYVLFVRKNALQILIPKYGLEGTLYLGKNDGGKDKTITVQFTYNEENQSQSCGSIVFRAFDPVTVQLSLDSSNVQRERLVFQLVYPKINGFSVQSVGTKQTPKDLISPKRKEQVQQPKNQKRIKKKDS